MNIWRPHLTFFLLGYWLKTGSHLLAFSKRVHACWLLIDVPFSKWAIVILQPTTKSQKRFSFKPHTFMHDFWYSVNCWFMSRVTVVMKEPITLVDHEHALYHLPHFCRKYMLSTIGTSLPYIRVIALQSQLLHYPNTQHNVKMLWCKVKIDRLGFFSSCIIVKL